MKGFRDYFAYQECVGRTAGLLVALERAGVPPQRASAVIREGVGQHVGRALGIAGGALLGGGIGAVPGAMAGQWLGTKFDNWMSKGRVAPLEPKFQQAKALVDDLAQSVGNSLPNYTGDPTPYQQLQKSLSDFSQTLDQSIQAKQPTELDQANRSKDTGLTGAWNKAGDWAARHPVISGLASTAAGMAGAGLMGGFGGFAGKASAGAATQATAPGVDAPAPAVTPGVPGTGSFADNIPHPPEGPDYHPGPWEPGAGTDAGAGDQPPPNNGLPQGPTTPDAHTPDDVQAGRSPLPEPGSSMPPGTTPNGQSGWNSSLGNWKGVTLQDGTQAFQAEDGNVYKMHHSRITGEDMFRRYIPETGQWTRPSFITQFQMNQGSGTYQQGKFTPDR